MSQQSCSVESPIPGDPWEIQVILPEIAKQVNGHKSQMCAIVTFCLKSKDSKMDETTLKKLKVAELKAGALSLGSTREVTDDAMRSRAHQAAALDDGQEGGAHQPFAGQRGDDVSGCTCWLSPQVPADQDTRFASSKGRPCRSSSTTTTSGSEEPRRVLAQTRCNSSSSDDGTATSFDNSSNRGKDRGGTATRASAPLWTACQAVCLNHGDGGSHARRRPQNTPVGQQTLPHRCFRKVL